MASVASQSAFTAPPTTSPPHGIKRPADAPVDNEQRLSKRFGLLNIVDATHATRLYIPLPASTQVHHASNASSPIPTAHPLASTFPLTNARAKPRKPRNRTAPREDAMDVEDTPSRIYIHDLAAELSDIESDEETPIFLPDIERHLARIPRQVLLGSERERRQWSAEGPRGTGGDVDVEPVGHENNQMVVYGVPASLTVREEDDSVRRVIGEARARIRERQGHAVQGHATDQGMILDDEHPSDLSDGDAMDLD